MTTTTSGAAKAVLTVVDWGEPETSVIDAGAPGVLVRLKGAERVPVVAVTVYEPVTVLAVTVTEATPFVPVFAVRLLVMPAPLAGPVKVIVCAGDEVAVGVLDHDHQRRGEGRVDRRRLGRAGDFRDRRRAPGVLVRLKGAERAPLVAVTVYEPVTVLAVTVTEATPFVPVFAVRLLVMPAPLAGPVKVIVAPGTRLP